MGTYRLGTITVQDEEAGALVLDGDGFAAAGEIATLLTNAAVGKYLGLSESEMKRARELVDDYRSALTKLYADGHWVPPSLDPQARTAREHFASGVERLLGPERAARLKRLSWRIRGGTALVDDDVAETLQLTPLQRTSIAEAAQQSEQENQRLLQSIGHARQGRLMSHRPLEEAGQDAARAADEHLTALLTPEQRERFELMKRGQT